MIMNNKRGQIWIETVIYTLIGLAIIGIILSIVKPAIDEKKDQVLLEKSLEMLQNIEDKTEDVKYFGAGNSAPVELKISKGQLTINGAEDNIEFSMDSRYMYSELGKDVSIGNINATTNEKGSGYTVTFFLNYENKMNITWNDKDVEQVFTRTPNAETIIITNLGRKGNLLQIDFS